MSIEDKRAQICGISFLPLPDAEIINIPGNDEIQVAGEWVPISVSSGEWQENRELVGMPVEQELKATVTDTSSSTEGELHKLLANDGLLLLCLTNGEEKVVGTDEFPVRLSMERSGSPGKITLSFKRSSPEPAKILTSF